MTLRHRDFSHKPPISKGNRTTVHFDFKKLLPALGWTFALGLFAGCALVGGGTDLERASGYSVSPPDPWKNRSRGDSDRAYLLPSGNIVTLVSSCNRNPDAPLDVLTRHLLMGT